MSSRRYHIHVICIAHSQPLILDSLAVFFQSRAFLTYDVATTLPQSALYSRQCVDACDYAIIVIGDSYGTSPNMVVSQMHLGYLSAKSKSKPIMTLVRRQYESPEISQQLKDFTRLVERQTSHIYYYDDNTDIKQLLSSAYTNLLAGYKTSTGWIRVNDSLLSEATTIEPSDNTAGLSLSEAHSKTSESAVGSYANDSYTSADNVTRVIELSETFEVEYTAQAFEGGNLTDVVMTMTLSWQSILFTLGNMPVVFSNNGLQNNLNRLIALRAEQEVKQLMPKVHAVSRSQITKNYLDKLQRTLIAANWIQIKVSGSDLRETKELWSLTFYAKTLYENSQAAAADSQKS